MKSKHVTFLALIAVPIAFCGGIGVGAYCFTPHNVEQTLEFSLEKLEKELDENGDFRQAHLNTLSGYLLGIATMQCDWAGLEICNRDDYGKIEAEYLKEDKAWDRAFHAEQAKPSEFEGGSMAPFDSNMRLYSLLRERLKILNKKYRRH